MSGLIQSIGGISQLTSSVPNITNPFQPIPLPTAASSFGDLSSIGLDPTEQALVDFLGGQQDIRTEDIYARLGLGGSTMEAQDLGANELQRLAESAGLISQNRSQAIQEQQVSGGQQLQEQQTATNAALSTQANQLNAARLASANTTSGLNNLVSGVGSLTSGLGSLASSAAV